MRILIRSLLSILFIVFFIADALPQAGKIAGKITDASTKEVLPFVNVIIEGTTQGAATNLNGEYYILNLTPGVYSVKATAVGYNPVVIKNIKVATGFTSTVDFTLQPVSMQLQNEVVVTAERPIIQKDLTASTSVIGADMISQLPVTEIRDVLQLQAGIVSSGGDLHMRGGRKGQIAFQVDGVPMTDAYDGSTVVDVNSNAVQEMQVISGAFNAEYGQAMSGIVNIVTKDGNNDFSGNVTAYTGSYLSGETDKFWNLNKVNPTAVRNAELSLSGPILNDKLFFYTNGRYFYNQGYLFGKRTFLTTDQAYEIPGSSGSAFYVSKNGDDSFVPMNPNTKYFGQGKLTYRMAQGIKVNFNYMYDYQKYKDFNSSRRLTPDNNLQRFRKGITNTLSINHALSNASFYNLNLSYFYKDYHHYLFENIYTDGIKTNYVDNNVRQTPAYSFEIGGTDYNRFQRSTSTYNGKLDWSTQLSQEVNLQFGGEYKRHQIAFHEITLYPFTQNGVQTVGIAPVTSNLNNQYLHKPQEMSAYIQSKFEAYSLIFNIGVRVDGFNPDGVVLSDPSDPNIIFPVKPGNRFFDNNGNGVQDAGEATKTVSDRESYWYKKAKFKAQISPRIGLAFPITDKGVIHFSYGHFLQQPSYELMYQNPEFELGSGSGNQGLIGNADLKPQKTVKGEIGLQQQLGDDIGLDVTMFFEDFRDLTGTQTDEILVFGNAVSYSKYANSDFGFSKGIIIKLQKRFSEGLATSIDYTYSVTKGNASDPSDARNAITGGALPETFIAPLNWDQAHTLNLSVAYTQARDWGVSLIGSFFTGQPYTPTVNKNTLVTQNAFPRNSESKPSIFNLDLRLFKDFTFGNTTLSAFLRVFNLLDLSNATNVNGDTGDPIFTFSRLDAEKLHPRLYYNTLDEFYTNPGNFSEPRRVEFGVTYSF